VFVTVGTTKFEALVATATSEAFIEAIKQKGYDRMVVQYGNGPTPPPYLPTDSFTVEYYKFKPTLADDVREAALVISHAGAGTCLEVLEAGRPLLVIINEALADNHQVELASQLHQDGHCEYATCGEAMAVLLKLDASALAPFPKHS